MTRRKTRDFVTRIEWEPENGDIAFDEIVAKNVDIHIERMDDGYYWMGIYPAASENVSDIKRQVVRFGTKRGAKIIAETEPD